MATTAKSSNSIPMYLGKYIDRGIPAGIEILPSNPSLKRSFIFAGDQGAGKTSLVKRIYTSLYKIYRDTNGEYGCIPIIFSPLFEWFNLEFASKNENLPPKEQPFGLNILKFTFPNSNVEQNLSEQELKEVKIIRFRFCKLSAVEIALFAGLSEQNDLLGYLKKSLKKLREEKGSEYTLDDFIEVVESKSNSATLALYHIMTDLKEQNIFCDGPEEVDWLAVVKKRLPIVISYGEIEDEDFYQGTAAIILKELYNISLGVQTAIRKQARSERYERELGDYGLKIAQRFPMSEEDIFFLKYYKLGLFFEEAHNFFPPTPSKMLRAYPCIKYMVKICVKMGRKRGFKYTMLITQNLMLIYMDLRKAYDYILTSSPAADDVAFYLEHLKLSRDNVIRLMQLRKAEFQFALLPKERSMRPFAFKAYRSPCGVPE